MKTLIFRGYSDDTFGEYGITQTDFCSDKSISCVIGRKLIVTGEYSRVGGGTWDIGVSLYDEETPLPQSWNLGVSIEDISTVLSVSVPSDVTLWWYVGGELVKKENVYVD